MRALLVALLMLHHEAASCSAFVTNCPHGIRVIYPMLSCHLGRSALLSLRASAIKYGEMQHAGVLVQDVSSAVKFYTEVHWSTHARGSFVYGCVPLLCPRHAQARTHRGTHSHTHNSLFIQCARICRCWTCKLFSNLFMYVHVNIHVKLICSYI